MKFEIVGQIDDIETTAIGKSIRVLRVLNKKYGRGRRSKKKGVAAVRLVDGSFRRAEVYWYEAHGIGKREIKIKFPFLD